MIKKSATLILLLCGLASASADQPNIVFFFADDQTTSTLGCYGNDVIKTPNIDTLARNGTRFENSFVSHSICWVSRTMILTPVMLPAVAPSPIRSGTPCFPESTPPSKMMRGHRCRMATQPSHHQHTGEPARRPRKGRIAHEIT